MVKKIKLLLVEDNRLLREGILNILKLHKDILVLSSSQDGKDSLQKIRKLKPNVVLLDLGLRSFNSLHVVEIIKKEFPEAKIIVMDLSPVQADILQYVKAGANGFILKDTSLNDFIITIRSVAEGKTVLPLLLGDSLFSKIIENAVRDGKPKLREAIMMTKKEKEVFDLLGDGLTNKEIGQKIHIKTETVKSHIHNIMEKLTLHSRLETANYSFTDKTFNTIAASITMIN